MACTNQQYFVGNGKVLFRKVVDDCGSPSEGYREIGDASELMIAHAQDFGSHFESQTGTRNRAARWKNSTEVSFTLSLQNLSPLNLVDLLQGTDSGAVVAGTSTNELVTNSFLNRTAFTAFPGIVITSIVQNTFVTALVSGTDYTLDSRNGGITMISSANMVGAQPWTLKVTYTHVGIEGLVKALKTPVRDFQIRFNGINLNAPNKPVFVEMFRAQVNATEQLRLIGQEITALTFTGALLPDANNDFYKVTIANPVP